MQETSTEDQDGGYPSQLDQLYHQGLQLGLLTILKSFEEVTVHHHNYLVSLLSEKEGGI